jgi:hypothetical protein
MCLVNKLEKQIAAGATTLIITDVDSAELAREVAKFHIDTFAFVPVRLPESLNVPKAAPTADTLAFYKGLPVELEKPAVAEAPADAPDAPDAGDAAT